MLKVNLNHLHFKGIGDSQWWRHLNFNFDYFNLSFSQDIKFTDSNKLIYEPNISQELGNTGIECVKDGSIVKLIPNNTRVVISTVQEPICVEGNFFYHENININDKLEIANADTHNVCWASGDFFAPENNTSNIKTFFVPGWNHFYWEEIYDIPEELIDQRTFDHTFLSFNRIHKPHRMYFLLRIRELGILDNNLISCAKIMDGETFEEHIEWIVTDKKEYKDIYDKYNLVDSEKLRTEANEFMNELPLVLDVEDFQQNGCFYDDTVWSSASFYQNSFMSILTESSAIGPGCYISEVVFKAIVFMHPFMIIGQPRTLEVLREWGFDTFDDVFDNSYDLEEDMFKRTEMVIEQMEVINKLTPEQLAVKTLELKDRLVYNKKRYFSKEFKEITKSYFDDVYNWLDNEIQ
jgi:hypothetical protein